MIVSRQVKFFIIEKLLLPLALLPLRALIKTWRVQTPDVATIQGIMAAERVVLVTYHGLFFHLLACARLTSPYGRPLVVMTSPSYDGQLLAAFLRSFGIHSVRASSRSRSMVGGKEFIRRVQAGDLGLIAVDGPRGPCCVAKPGFLKIAALARAQLLLIVTSASYGVTFGTWDRAHLPGPFARIDLSVELLPAPSRDGVLEKLSSVSMAMQTLARQTGPAKKSGPNEA